MAQTKVARKLAAIVAADVAGYSRLMSTDEAGTLSALHRHSIELFDPLIGEHGGRVARLSHIFPEFCLGDLRRWPFRDPGFWEHFVGGLAEAGLPQ